MSYVVRRLEPAGHIVVTFVSLDRDQIDLWLHKQKGRKYNRPGRVWIEARDRPATRRGRGRHWPPRGLVTT